MERVRGISSSALALRAELQGKKTRRIGSVAFGDRCAVLRLGSDSLWAIVEGRKGSGLALRCAWAPGAPLELFAQTDGEIRLGSSLGEYRVRIAAPTDDALLRVTTTLVPAAEVRVPWWPRDLYPLGERGDPEAAQGSILAAQRGFNTALLYGRLDAPGDGTFFYLQDLSALNDYANASGTMPDGVVGGDWPELGYQPRPAQEGPLPEGRPIVLSDAFLRLDPQSLDDKRDEARLFLEHQAAIYPFLQKPEVSFRDWPARAEATIRDLAESPLVTIEDGGYRYARPYVDAESPDSMVQLALLHAVREYGAWKGETPSLAEELRAGVSRFYDPEIGSIRRYLNTVGPEKDADAVDSWYLYHPLGNLANLAKAGDEGAKELFVGSLDYAIEVARLFEYAWPIQFSLSSLQITTASRKPGKAEGQTDAGGLYAYVMLDAYELTGETRYLDEAQAAIRATSDMMFNLVYQTNLTSWGAAACVRLWKATDDRFFLDQTSVFLASFFHNCAIWQSDLGRVSEPVTFLGVTCLHNGPYLAPFECYESFCAFHEALILGGDDLPVGARTLMAEFVRYALERGWWFYPSSLKETDVAHSPRNGENVRALAFPLEDLYVNGDAAGQVGQEVYGAGAALMYASRAFHPLGKDRLLFCEYPVRDFERTAKGVSFTVCGAPGGVCQARVIPPDGATITVDSKRVAAEEFDVRVGAKVQLRWGT